MSSISLSSMKDYLSISISSLNKNKLNGMLAELDFRKYLHALGFGDRVSMGGWIARTVGPGQFGHNTIVFFPNIILPDTSYPLTNQFPSPNLGLHTICATFHQIGIASYFCTPTVSTKDNPTSIQWHAVELGLPTEQRYRPFPSHICNFTARTRRYNFLHYHTDISSIPDISIAEEFSKQHLLVEFQSKFMSEISDVDGILWGSQFTYPLEIKEKTPASDKKLGQYFGLDVGPFTKLAFYAAKHGNLHSIFVVREIDNVTERNLVKWWFIKFDNLAQYASWVFQSGGMNMLGGQSAVVKIPKSEFTELDITALEKL